MLLFSPVREASEVKPLASADWSGNFPDEFNLINWRVASYLILDLAQQYLK